MPLIHRLSAAVVAGLSLVSLAVAAPPPALADPVSDKRAEAERTARELDRLSKDLAAVTEDYNEARVRADEADERVRSAATELRAADARMAKVRSRVREQAVAAYIRGGNAPALVVVVQAKLGDDLGVRQAYIRSVAMHTADSLDELRAARLTLEDEQDDLAASRDAARSALRAVDGRRRQVAAAAGAHRRRLETVQGALRAMVDVAARHRAEDAARRVQAELAERQARQAASRNATKTGEAAAPAGGPGAPAPGAAAAVAEARRHLGKPYQYGSPGPNSFDCSGLTSYAWRAGGKTLPHSSRAQWSATARVPLSALQPGDLVFYGQPIHHVGIYVGDGQMVEASETGTPVRQTTIYRSDLVGAGRVN